jgi:hypothetical protein
MGAWGTGAFDNDTACDWAAELQGADDLTPVAAALERVAGAGEEYLDSDAACEALAACEVVARLKGNWGRRDAYTEVVDRWVASHPGEPSQELIAQALAAMDRLSTPPSELVELWEESDDNSEWLGGVQELRSRVAG